MFVSVSHFAPTNAMPKNVKSKFANAVNQTENK